MFKNNVKIAFRNVANHKGYSFINLFGLAIGIACFTIILLYIQDELSYDRFHNDSDQIFRVVRDSFDPAVAYAHVPPGLMPAMQQEIPELEQSVRLYSENGLLSSGDKVFNSNGFRVDSTFFDIFSFSFVEGTPQSALTGPASIVLTESIAKKYFGDENALGQPLTLNRWGRRNELRVSGVIEDVPSQSHCAFDFLHSLDTATSARWDDFWGNGGRHTYYTYVKLNPSANIQAVTAKIQKLVEASKSDNGDVYSMQPLTGLDGIHLSSHRSAELKANNDSLYIKVLLFAAVFVILIAGINYVNLATARSAMRAKEIGVRKVVGAFRSGLIRQLLTESLLMAIMAGLIAIALTETSLPFFNTILQKQLSLFAQVSQPVWLFITAVVFSIGIFAGLYPALYLSAFKPASVLKKQRASTKSGLGLRQSLVVLQFGLAAMLMVGIIVVQKQLHYIQNANLGFEQDQVIIIPDSWQLPNRDYGSVIRHALAELPGVLKVGAGSGLGAIKDGAIIPMRAPGSNTEILINTMDVDHNYLDVYGLELKEGRNFSTEFPADSVEDSRMLLNETAVKQLGLQEPVAGQIVQAWGGDAVTIIGVVKDFHFSSLHNEIKPIGFVWEEIANSLAIKMAGGDIQETLTQIKNIWSEYAPGVPFDFYFLDAAIEKQYRFEQNFRTIFSAMTGLSIVIACLGLLGLVAFSAEQRTKEIGIRKVLGASVANVVTMLSRDFIKLIILANIAAWPIAYFAMNKWLGNFAYRIDMGPGPFALAGFLALLIAAITVSFQAIKAATANPVDSLS